MAAQMYDGPISADFREWARGAVEKSNNAEAVNKALEVLAKLMSLPICRIDVHEENKGEYRHAMGMNRTTF